MEYPCGRLATSQPFPVLRRLIKPCLVVTKYSSTDSKVCQVDVTGLEPAVPVTATCHAHIKVVHAAAYDDTATSCWIAGVL